MIDATFVEVPKQRNTRADGYLNAGGGGMPGAVAKSPQIKEGQVPEPWDKTKAQTKRRQKDPEVHWTKSDEYHYGYKNHINADAENKLIQSYAVPHAVLTATKYSIVVLEQG